ncbi:MAG TPA: glucosaminidase domain-containing protein, partial [Streptosporangiaceae bacterium]|nr:glucosaminidase domain-containing protein [Streptosporangiaceae bacterium]
SPSGMPIRLAALEKAAQPAPANDGMLRSAIVNVAKYFLRMAGGKTPAEMEAIIWQHDSIDGVDHGESCAAFASLTLELAAQALGQQSWVTGGTTYPWPLHKWADARVDPNPASPGVTSVLQDAQAHHRWHPLGDGYVARPGDWVLFDGHIEVVTSYSGGVLGTIGADSLPDLSVNAHQYQDPLAPQGVAGFVDNGQSASAVSPARANTTAATGQPPTGQGQRADTTAATGHPRSGNGQQAPETVTGAAAIPGIGQPGAQGGIGNAGAQQGTRPSSGEARTSRAHGRPLSSSGGAVVAGRRQTPGQTPPGGGSGPDPAEAGPQATGGQAAAGQATGGQAAGGQAAGGQAGSGQAGGGQAGGGQAADGQVADGGADIPGLPSASGNRPVASSPALPVPARNAGAGGSRGSRAGARAQRPRRPGPPRLRAVAGASQTQAGRGRVGTADVPGAMPAVPAQAGSIPGAALIPGLLEPASQATGGSGAGTATRYRRHQPSDAAAGMPGPVAQHAFIGRVAPGAIASQRKYGVPAAVTIAQAIDESAWGQSSLAVRDHNLFGIKGSGPAGSDTQPTQEFVNGQLVTQTATFRVYYNLTQSVDDHGRLLATSGYYQQAMAQRQDPNGFAASLAGVYATDPQYGAKLISLMQRYDLYRFDHARPGSGSQARRHDPAGSTSGTRTSASDGSHPAVFAAAGSGARPNGGGLRAGASARRGNAAGTSSGVRATAPDRPARAPDTHQHRAGTAASPGWAAIPGFPADNPGGRSPHAVPRPRSTAGRAGTASDVRSRERQASGTGPRLSAARAATQTVTAKPMSVPSSLRPQRIAPRNSRGSVRPYQPQIPASVKSAYLTTAKFPLLRGEPLYRDVASQTGIRWELLAACDWMQCEANPRYSPVHGEKLGTVNADGMVYHTKSEALAQCAEDLVQLARAVYQVDATAPRDLSVRDLANIFAAFRWGGLLRSHRTSAMEFPYSVAGLTPHHLNMRWPDIQDRNVPDKPGGRFRMPFGAVPIVLGLNYPATV